MIAQLRSELLKQRTTRTSLLLMGWMLGLILLIVLLHVFGLKAGTLSQASSQPKIFGWGTSIGALFAALLGAIGVTGEIRSGTIRPTLLANPNRGAVIAAKLAASAIAGVTVGLISEALVSAVGSAGLAARGIHIALDAGDYAQMLAGGAAAAALWAAIGIGIGALVRNQIGAVTGLCVWLLLIESVLIGDVPVGRQVHPRRHRRRAQRRDPEHQHRHPAHARARRTVTHHLRGSSRNRRPHRHPTPRYRLRRISMQSDQLPPSGGGRRFLLPLLIAAAVTVFVVLHLTGIVGPGSH
jgi:hypothetical protein